jgi:serine phosphatase RsbU (regulator of sigma subunit)
MRTDPPGEVVVALPSDAESAAQAETLIERTLAAWAERWPVPTVVRTSLDRLGELVESGAEARQVIAVVGGPDAARAARRIAGMAGRVFASAVVLHEPGEALPDHDQVLTERWDAEPSVVAGLMAGLRRQHRALRRLVGELRVAHTVIDSVQRQLAAWNEEMRRASRVQREFLPRAGAVLPGLDVGVVYRPAGTVSGDVYDVRAVDERTVSFFVADAVGHGMPAALQTLVLTRSLRRTEGITGPGGTARIIPPGEALARLNDELIELGCEQQRFATAVYGLLDVPTGRVTLAGAGHPAALVLGPGGVREIESTGPMLGVFAGAQFEQTQATVAPGEVVVVYSDGFELAFPDPARPGKPTRGYVERMRTAAAGWELAAGGLGGAASVLDAALDAHAGSLHQPDDVTAVLLGVVDRAGGAGTDDAGCAGEHVRERPGPGLARASAA